MHTHYEVSIRCGQLDTTLTRTVRATSPDQALDRVEKTGDYLPDAGDRITRIRGFTGKDKDLC